MKIREDNYELLIFQYKEGLLGDDQCRELERALEEHPEWRAVADMYDPDLRVVDDESLLFPDKESLRRIADNVTPSATPHRRMWIRLGAAACVAAIIAIGAVKLLTANGEGQSVVAENNIPQQTASADNGLQNTQSTVNGASTQDPLLTASQSADYPASRTLAQVLTQTTDYSAPTDCKPTFNNSITPQAAETSERQVVESSDQLCETTEQQRIRTVDQQIGEATPCTSATPTLTDALITYVDDAYADPRFATVVGSGTRDCLPGGPVLADGQHADCIEGLISFQDSGDEPLPTTSKSPLGTAISDWFDELRLAGTELHTAILTQIGNLAASR